MDIGQRSRDTGRSRVWVPQDDPHVITHAQGCTSCDVNEVRRRFSAFRALAEADQSVDVHLTGEEREDRLCST